MEGYYEGTGVIVNNGVVRSKTREELSNSLTPYEAADEIIRLQNVVDEIYGKNRQLNSERDVLLTRIRNQANTIDEQDTAIRNRLIALHKAEQLAIETLNTVLDDLGLEEYEPMFKIEFVIKGTVLVEGLSLDHARDVFEDDLKVTHADSHDLTWEFQEVVTNEWTDS